MEYVEFFISIIEYIYFVLRLIESAQGKKKTSVRDVWNAHVLYELTSNFSKEHISY